MYCRLSNDLHHESGANGVLELVKAVGFDLPAIYISFTALRFVQVAVCVKVSSMLRLVKDVHISWGVSA